MMEPPRQPIREGTAAAGADHRGGVLMNPLDIAAAGDTDRPVALITSSVSPIAGLTRRASHVSVGYPVYS